MHTKNSLHGNTIGVLGSPTLFPPIWFSTLGYQSKEAAKNYKRKFGTLLFTHDVSTRNNPQSTKYHYGVHSTALSSHTDDDWPNRASTAKVQLMGLLYQCVSQCLYNLSSFFFLFCHPSPPTILSRILHPLSLFVIYFFLCHPARKITSLERSGCQKS